MRCRYYRKGYCLTAQCRRGERLCCGACPLMRECRRRGELCRLYMRKTGAREDDCHGNEQE
jgi:hypothetical protein